MPIYRYTAYNARGKEEKGIVDAQNPAGARRQLKGRNLYVTKIVEDTERRERELFPALSRLLYRVPRRDVGLFARQLGTLLDAGLPLDRSITNIVEQTENIYLKKALVEIRSDVIEGESLSDAMKKHSSIFPPIYYNLVAVGEKTGQYEKTLLRLADLEEANQALKNKVSTALFYPVIMLFFLGGIMIFLMGVVVPRIQVLFAQMNQELPFVTRFVLFISDIISTWKIIFPILFLTAFVILIRRYLSTEQGRENYERLLLRTFLIGNLIRKFILARFSRNLGVMLKHRVPLITSLQVVSKIVNNRTFEKEIQSAIRQIQEGTRITDAFRDSVIVTQMFLGMLSAGEASDKVPEMVEKIADVLDNEVDASISKLSTLIEPALMVITGGFIILIMVAILLPIYSLTKQMNM
jgi:general secretion pathway protein F